MAGCECMSVRDAYREMWGQIAQLQALAAMFEADQDGPPGYMLIEPHVVRAVDALSDFEQALRRAGVDYTGGDLGELMKPAIEAVQEVL